MGAHLGCALRDSNPNKVRPTSSLFLSMQDWYLWKALEVRHIDESVRIFLRVMEASINMLS